MAEKSPRQAETAKPNPDEVLRRMLVTPPQPRNPKIKAKKPERN